MRVQDPVAPVDERVADARTACRLTAPSASSTCLAIGAATVPPCPAALHGHGDGDATVRSPAKPMNQGWLMPPSSRSPPCRSCRRPRRPPAPPRCRCPPGRPASSSPSACAAALGDITRSASSGLGSSTSCARRVDDLRRQPRLHPHAAVGDRLRHRRHLQRRDRAACPGRSPCARRRRAADVGGMSRPRCRCTPLGAIWSSRVVDRRLR